MIARRCGLAAPGSFVSCSSESKRRSRGISRSNVMAGSAPILNGLRSKKPFAVSPRGALAYLPKGPTAYPTTRLVTVDRRGE